MNKQVTSTSRLCVLGLTLLLAVLLPGATMAAPASPGDGDEDGIITGPRLVGGTIFRGCFASGPDTSGNADPSWDKDVDTITGALKGTGSWQDANMTKLKNGKRADIENCVNAAKGVAEPGDEFIFYFSGHGGNHTFQDGVKDQHETAADPNDDPDDFDNHILLGDTTAGTRSRMSDDELAKLLSGFKQSVTIVVILDSCNSHTFTDGSADLGSVTQKDPGGNDVPATSHLALIAASTASNPSCRAGMTDRIADGLKSQGSHPKADKNKDGVVTAKEAADHARAYLPELKPKCDEAEPYECPMPEESRATYRGPLPPEVDNCPTEPNPDQMDSDGDYYGNVCDEDDDGDGLTDEQEILEFGTNPLKADTDTDEMPDGYEVRFPCLEATAPDAVVDSDGDGPPNLMEYQQGTDPCTPGSGDDYGDAPEGVQALAYPTLGVLGAFPTCKTVGAATWAQHGLGSARFVWTGTPQPAWDAEMDGNAGLCPNCFPAYDADECYRDGDAGLMFPQPYTIDNLTNVTTCPNSLGTALGTTCQVATWGGNVDIWIVNNMQVEGYVNVLMDWNQDGDWTDVVACPAYPTAPIPEHVLVNFPVPSGFNGPLSQLFPPNFLIGPKADYVWARFSITDRPVSSDWDGSGTFVNGESEDYLLEISEPDPGIKWSQLPNRSLPGLHAHDSINTQGLHEQITLADDWLCQGGEVTDLHWWGNYETIAAGERRGAGIDHFHLSIHATDPTGACLPGDPPLWIADVPFNLVAETDTGLVNIEGSKIYKYSYVLLEPFAQIKGTSYWLDITAASVDPKDPAFWRWQEAARTTNPAFAPSYCGAAQRVDPTSPFWQTIVWSQIEPIRFSDMAFEVTSAPPEPEHELGDAPDSSNNSGLLMTAYPPVTQALFPTVYQTGSPPYGPLHLHPQGVAWLGQGVTRENEADLGPDEDGVNNIVPAADKPDQDKQDDGVSFPLRLPHCVPTTINYTVNVVTPPLTDMYINVWFDWWRDGEWDDTAQCGQTLAPEWAVQNQILPAGTSSGPHVLTSPAFLPYHPPSSLDPNPLWMRITLSEQRWSGVGGAIGYGGSGPQGGYEYGETEDYYLESYLSALDWGDAPDGASAPGYPTLLLNNGARHFIVPGGPFMGVLIDTEADGQPDATATGDDLSNLADEDGVTFPAPLQPGDPAAPVHIDMLASTTGCLLNAWIDFNGDKDWSDPGEQIFVDESLAGGFMHTRVFAVPGTPPFTSGSTYARFRCSTQGGLGPAGGAPDGEVEDYQVWVKEPLDWGDAPDPPYPTLAANNGASHILTPNGPVLGALVDAEPNGQPNAAASGDELGILYPGIVYPPGDEDGVTFATPLLSGQQACVNVGVNPAGPGGLLDAWIDFNRNGIWGDSTGEQIFTTQPVAAGPNLNLCFPVPAGAYPGPTFARFRLSLVGGLPPIGLAPDGEVEDYQVTIDAVKWNQPPVLNPASPHPNCYWGWDDPSVYSGERIVADDWKCTDRRPVTDIHWWGSYQEWRESEAPPSPLGPDMFHIGIWTDVPAGSGTPWSHPAKLIWEKRVPRPATQERAVGCDFYPGSTQMPDTCFLYSYTLPQKEWFYQNPNENQVYWISISAIYLQGPPTMYVWGWKTRPWQNFDAAVRIANPTAPSVDSVFVSGEPIINAEGWWDMAFVLTTPAYDYGDAPDPAYPTRLANDGARHIYSSTGPFMGAGVDTEPDGQPVPPALGDDNNATDDEDGVTFLGPWVINQAAKFNVDMRGSPAACNLSAWVDFNANGSWLDLGEQVATDVPLAAGAVHILGFPIPPFPTAVPGITYARFRCSSQAGLGPAGEASDGEVEDYRVELLAPPKPPILSASILSFPTLRLSWPKVTADIYGNARLADGYYIYWNSSPYWTPAPGSHEWWLSEPGLPNPVTQGAAHLGDPGVHHFYIVRAVYVDIWGNTLESADSGRVGEFEFTLVPGSP